MEVSAALQSMDSTLKDIREVNGIDFAFDPVKYAAWKLRAGQAVAGRGAYFTPIAPGGTVNLVSPQPVGAVWMGLVQTVAVSLDGVIELTIWVDTDPTTSLPWAHFARIMTATFNWPKTLPTAHVSRLFTVLRYTNHDAAVQWVSGQSHSVFIRSDVWQRDKELLDRAAEKYSTPPEVIVGN